jgi:hypothetical protein
MREAKNLSQQRSNREISLTSWCQNWRRIKSVRRDRQRGSEKWGICQCYCTGLREHSFQFFALYFWAVLALETSCMLKLIDYRVKWLWYGEH